ncbi:DUF4397 domain-containing protein [Halobaculum sp. CBA1158]|uniref:DUF4397 domain-containing protein n=1 Tax=Halobaculum sp. CBA1158 TaxID=2904243 RepID=UPI001F364517|nr:DUF4397 domain-containing protein [Halobaculum sp. CBA1158]UIO99358.1 DUF4397 domain-containing protein [Halobaculum sp. CBA1158]
MRYPTGTLAVALALILVGSVLASGATLGGVAGPAQTTAQADDEPAEPVTQETAYLRVVHASPDAPAVNVSLDNETVVSDLGFGNDSEYLQIESGDYRLTISAAGTDEVVYEANITVESRAVTTVAASGEVGENATVPFSPLFVRDDALTPAEGDAAVAVAHLSPDAPEVDIVTEGGTVIAENVTYGTVTDYVTVPAGDYTLEIRAATADNDGEVVDTVDVSLDEGSAYTAYAIGYFGADADENDSVGNETETPMDNETETPPADDNQTETPMDNETETPSADDTAPDGEPFQVSLVADATTDVTLPSEREPADDNETETPMDNETETPMDNGTESPSDDATETPDDGTESPPPTATETPAANETETSTETETGDV